MRISMMKAQKLLIIVWLIGSGLLFLLILIQTFKGSYADKVEEAWSWLLPIFMPTLSLIVGIFVVNSKSSEPKYADRFTFRLAFCMSIIYLALASLAVLLKPYSSTPPLKLMQMSNLWLAPIQGLLNALIGIFFIKSKS